MEIDNGFFRVFGPYFIGKSIGTLKNISYLDFGHLSDTPIILAQEYQLNGFEAVFIF